MIGAVVGAVLVAAPVGMVVAGVLTSVIDARAALGDRGLGVALAGLFLAVVRATRGVDDRLGSEAI